MKQIPIFYLLVMSVGSTLFLLNFFDFVFCFPNICISIFDIGSGTRLGLLIATFVIGAYGIVGIQEHYRKIRIKKINKDKKLEIKFDEFRQKEKSATELLRGMQDD